MALTKQGVERLLEVVEVIKKDPAGFDMYEWLGKGENRPNHCNTVGCIAGWLVALNRSAAVNIAKKLGAYNPNAGPRIEQKITISLAPVATRLIADDDIDYSALFYVDGWPEQEIEVYDKAFAALNELAGYGDDDYLENLKTPKAKKIRKEMVTAAVKRIKGFIKENKPVPASKQ